ncbi:hypothetical protein F0562_020063 [Nyssa sinensis]|uniref:Uncharacterized protein n=1 Tax=Nyssa sinensis TaxID=561372 RepID=A0A5J5BQW1_9ASTE|nr:hypothetical protein F0562_020063 [Nyssa sinensis]
MGNSKRASAQMRPFDADDITTASTRPFDDNGYIGYDPRLLSQCFNESYFAAADDEEHYTAVADPPYHVEGLPPLTRLEKSPPPLPTSAPPGSVTLPVCRSLTAGVVLDNSEDRSIVPYSHHRHYELGFPRAASRDLFPSLT